MTNRQFEAITRRLLQLVDDPQERRKLLRQALDADSARHHHKALGHLRAIERIERRNQRFTFLFECVAELMPDIQNLDDMPMGQLIARVEPTYPELAEQLRELLGMRS